MKISILAVLFAASLSVSAQAQRIESEAGAADLLGLTGRIAVNSTSGALARLCRGEVDIAGAARAATPEERATCARNGLELVELSNATGSLALVVNPANTWAKQISAADMKRIWLEAPGKATSWRQANPAWPEAPLKLYGPGPKMGLAVVTRAALNQGVQPSHELRGDINATDVLAVVVEGVARDKTALGLVDRATYQANAKRVRLVPTDAALSYSVYAYAARRQQ